MDAYFSLVKLTRIGWEAVTTWQIETILVSVVLSLLCTLCVEAIVEGVGNKLCEHIVH